MDDVSGEMGISKKTLYTHFKDKEELIKKVIDSEFEKNIGAFEELKKSTMNAIEHLLKVNTIVNKQISEYSPSLEYDLKKYYPGIYQKLSERKNGYMQEAIRQNLEQGKKEGIYRETLDVEVITKLYVTRINNIHEEDLFPAEEFVSPHVFLECFEYHIRGISNEKGIKIFENYLKTKSTE